MKTENSIVALVKAMNRKNDAERASELHRIDGEIKALEADIIEQRRDSSTVYCGWGTQHDQLLAEWNEIKYGYYAWDEVKEEIVWEV
jgi:hypothetical protein